MRKLAIFLPFLAALAAALPLTAEPLIKNGDAVAFMGDSITQQGAGNAYGYLHLIEKGLAANDIKIIAQPAGISGNRSSDMLARLEAHVLARTPKPAWMTLSCGVNDVWHSTKGTGIPLEAYKASITAIVDQAQAAGIKVMILTATLIGPDHDDPLNLMAVDYNNFLRDLARERKLPLADLNALMKQEQPSAPGHVGAATALTVDGVHMNHLGNMMMARGVLRAFGLSDEQMALAEASWSEIPIAATVQMTLTIREMNQLQAMMKVGNKGMNEVVYQILSERLAADRAGAKPAE